MIAADTDYNLYLTQEEIGPIDVKPGSCIWLLRKKSKQETQTTKRVAKLISICHKMVNYTSSFCEGFKEQYEIIAKSSNAIYIVIFGVNAIMSIIASLGNSLIIDALRRCTSLHAPSKALLFSLALSDLGVGCIAQPLFVIHRLAALTRSYHIFCVSGIGSYFVGSTLVSASFVTSTAIAIDRYLALRLPLRYREVVTIKRVTAVLFASWLASLVWSALWFWDKEVQNCLRIVLFSLCFVTTTSSYFIIYKHMRRYRFRVEEHVGSAVVHGAAGSHFNTLRFRRSVVSMCKIYCLLLACYLPYNCLMVLLNRLQLTSLTVALNAVFATLILSNSALNPFVFCRCIPEIRVIVKSMFSVLAATSN